MSVAPSDICTSSGHLTADSPPITQTIEGVAGLSPGAERITQGKVAASHRLGTDAFLCINHTERRRLIIRECIMIHKLTQQCAPVQRQRHETHTSAALSSVYTVITVIVWRIE